MRPRLCIGAYTMLRVFHFSAIHYLLQQGTCLYSNKTLLVMKNSSVFASVQ